MPENLLTEKCVLSILVYRFIDLVCPLGTTSGNTQLSLTLFTLNTVNH